MSMKFPRLAARIFNTPLLIHPQKLDALIAGLGGRLLGAEPAQIRLVGADQGTLLAPELFSTRRGERAERGYRVVDGVAVLSVSGALVHRSRMEGDSTWLVGYNDLASDLEDAMNNPEVHAVLQVYDSEGGEAQGAFEYGQRVFDLRGKKPLWSIADGMALSAGYLGSSAAEVQAVTATGYCGSVGVVARHVDFSRALDSEGITVTHIFAGAHKVDGNPYEPLPEAVRKDWQADIDGLYGMFVDAVAKHRATTTAVVRATQAATYSGQAAVGAGLADRVATTDQLIAELAAMRPRTHSVGAAAHSTAVKGANMSGTNPGGTQAAAPSAPANPQPAAHNPAAHSAADLDAARAEGARAERERASSILGHESARGREALAQQCVSTGLSLDQSIAILSASPVAAAASGGANPFAQHMAALGNPAVNGVEKPGHEANDAAAIASSWDAAFGVPAPRRA
ncbi:S49 family peptidase [Paracidovorax wautersii]|uniref:Peptidase family S49 n=1 Tax=Paracidovorax wautersii TaxID=1177982 RepID=A0A1I2E6S4_9BURK|nr:S49 family peptidase [Paracidovorax wautersii]SFE88674.1 Peptidase family S49 [Paracidovorax wautersii]